MGSPVALLITLTTAAASAAAVLAAPGLLADARTDLLTVATFLVLAALLQLASVDLYGKGGEGVSLIAMLAAGFTLGPGAAIAAGTTAALVQWARSRGILHRAIFDAANLSLAAACGTLVFQAITAMSPARWAMVVAATVAGIVAKTVNTTLLCFAMSLAEATPMAAIWNERFRWARYHYIAFGPLALASVLAYEQVGFTGLLAFVVPPALLVFTVRQYLDRTRAAVEEVRRRNEDLTELFEFAGGLAARAHDRSALVAYAERELSRLAGTEAQVLLGSADGQIELVAGGN